MKRLTMTLLAAGFIASCSGPAENTAEPETNTQEQTQAEAPEMQTISEEVQEVTIMLSTVGETMTGMA